MRRETWSCGGGCQEDRRHCEGPGCSSPSSSVLSTSRLACDALPVETPPDYDSHTLLSIVLSPVVLFLNSRHSSITFGSYILTFYFCSTASHCLVSFFSLFSLFVVIICACPALHYFLPSLLLSQCRRRSILPVRPAVPLDCDSARARSPLAQPLHGSRSLHTSSSCTICSRLLCYSGMAKEAANTLMYV